jgi:penicillin V acylase-like amidase (Ntn superfamily)
MQGRSIHHDLSSRKLKGVNIMKISKLFALVAVAVFTFCVIYSQAEACSRVVYIGVDSRVLTARSMDWKSDIDTDLWIFPRGMQRNGEVGPSSVKWTSKYGSVIASSFNNSTSDGMNEAGLSANLLWLAESDYAGWDGKKPAISIAIWAQYVLDNFATVKEAVKELSAEPFVVLSGNLPGGNLRATLHLSMSDSSGDSAILEYINGKLVIHHSRDYQVMTNSPIFAKQLALNQYWKEIGGTVMLPGTNRAADRYVRAMFYINAIPKVEDQLIATASVFSVIRNVSVPYGISTPDQPNISSTRWRTVADHKSKIYYFESALNPNIFWVDFRNVDFSAKAKIRKLHLGKSQTRVFAGDASSQFKEAVPFRFMGL